MKRKWPQIEEVENLRWTNNRTQYHSIGCGFCRAQDSCEDCVWKIRILCRIKRRIDEMRIKVIKRHYGIKKGW